MRTVEEIRERLQKVLDKKETFMFDYRNDIRILLSVIDRQAKVVEAAKEWKAAKEYRVIWKIQRAIPMLKKALSDMEKEVPSE